VALARQKGYAQRSGAVAGNCREDNGELEHSHPLGAVCLILRFVVYSMLEGAKARKD